MSLRFRRALHFAAFCSVALGLILIGVSVWMATFLWEEKGFLLAVEGFTVSISLVQGGLFCKLHASLYDLTDGGKTIPSGNGEAASGLAKLAEQAKAGPQDGYSFWSVGLGLATMAMVLFGGMIYLRGVAGPEWLDSRGFGVVTGRQFLIGWNFLIAFLLLGGQQCLLSAQVLQQQARLREGKGSKAGKWTQLTGAPSK